MSRTGNQTGFSFVELLMVVTVIAILAGFSVPFLQRVRMTSHEKVALANLRTIYSAQAMHHERFRIYGNLSALTANEFVDNSLGSGATAGYSYVVASFDQSSFTAVAVPLQLGVSGEKGFYIDDTGVLRYTEDGSPPHSSSPPWQ